MHKFIHRTQLGAQSLQELREQEAVIDLNQIVVRTEAGDYEFHDVAYPPTESRGRQSIRHYVAIGPGGALQVVARDRRTWPSQEGPREFDSEKEEMRHLRSRIDWEISRVFSPGYWQDVSAVRYGQWLDESAKKEIFTGVLE